jgi:thiamine pyrophosphate-dependent acetolactate synthase large subunit-like protein
MSSCGAEVLVANLKAQGVKHVFGIPGAKTGFFTVEVHVQNEIRSSLLPENADGIHIVTNK